MLPFTTSVAMLSREEGGGGGDDAGVPSHDVRPQLLRQIRHFKRRLQLPEKKVHGLHCNPTAFEHSLGGLVRPPLCRSTQSAQFAGLLEKFSAKLSESLKSSSESRMSKDVDGLGVGTGEKVRRGEIEGGGLGHCVRVS